MTTVLASRVVLMWQDDNNVDKITLLSVIDVLTRNLRLPFRRRDSDDPGCGDTPSADRENSDDPCCGDTPSADRENSDDTCCGDTLSADRETKGWKIYFKRTGHTSVFLPNRYNVQTHFLDILHRSVS